MANSLSLLTGEKYAGFAITNKRGDELYELAWYSLDRLQGDAVADLPDLNDRRFEKVNICFSTPHSVLTPAAHFKETTAAAMLSSFCLVNGSYTVTSEQVEEKQLYNTYAADRKDHEFLLRKFSNPDCCHIYSLGLKQHIAAKDCLQLHFSADEFSMLVFSGEQFLLAQTFEYASPDDVLYYILKAINLFGLSQEVVQVTITGLVDRHSALFREMYQYFLHVSFREAQWQTPAQEYPAHFFTLLNDLAQCGS